MTLEDLPSLSLDKDTFYFVSPWGLGDTMILCGLKPALEQKLGGKIHLVVKPSHEVIMKMYDYSDYTLAKPSHSDPHQSPTLLSFAKNHPTPQKGCFYVAHPEFFPHFKKLVSDMQTGQPHVRFLAWYKQFFGLSENTEFVFPIHYPTIASSLLNRFHKLAPGITLERTALLLPEATSVTGFPRLFWDHLIKQLQKRGLFVISNISNPTTPHFRGVPNIDLTLDELVALGIACKEVYAIRSGICDLLFSKQEHLHVFYPNNDIRRIFSLKEMFHADNIHEISVEDSSFKIDHTDNQGTLKKRTTLSLKNAVVVSTTLYYLGSIPLLSISESME